MEKRLVLFFVLSFLTLYIWAAFTQGAKNKNISTNNTQNIENKLVIKNNSAPVESPTNLSLLGDPPTKPQELFYTLQNDKFTLNFSNIGGNLLSVQLKEYNTELPISKLAEFKDFENYIFKVTDQQEKKIEFTLQVETLTIRKIFSIFDDYTLDINVVIENSSDNVKHFPINFKCFTLNMVNLDKHADGETVDKRTSTTDHSLCEYVLRSKHGIKRKNNAFKYTTKENGNFEENILWAGFRNRYYCAIIKPKFDSKEYAINAVNEKELNVSIQSEDSILNPMEKKIYSFTSYIGPEKLELLSKYEYGFEKIKRYYKWGIFDGIAKLIAWIMKIIFKIIPNWGVCIILISIIIYYSMYPLTARGMASMKKMQGLQPKIQSLKEKYENNPQKLNQEMLELYRKEKINPLGGCLPILLQMPVFIGLYQVLWRNVDFMGAKFLWIDDLSHPDRLFLLNFDLPIIGHEINLLPILMMIIMFFQQKFSSKNMVLTDPMQIQQQKMMATVMPLLLGFIFYKFASGLTLYFTMFYIFSTLTQWKLSNEPKTTN